MRDVLDKWGRETVLLFFMTGHWRKPIDFPPETMEAARAQVETFRNAFLERPARGGARRLGGAGARARRRLQHPRGARRAARVARAPGLAVLRRARAVRARLAGRAGRRRRREVLALAAAQDARARQDFAEADRLRGEIAAAGWEVRDVAEPPGFQLVPRRR